MRLFIIICWLAEIYYTFRYKSVISGHEFIEQDNGDLKCSVCGMVSKVEIFGGIE